MLVCCARRFSSAGFTLIELLIVVGIISILAAMAIPNMLEARTRSMVTRVKSDMRSLATALEAYHAEHTAYPPPSSNGHGARLFRLSTPVSFITDPKRWEPFYDNGLFKRAPYGYVGRNEHSAVFWNDDGAEGNFSGTPTVYWWLLRSSGPDNDRNGPAVSSLNATPSADDFCNYIYDPSNGTTSSGDIWRYGGEPTGRGADSATLLNH